MSQTLSSKSTIRKNAFYLVFECLVRKISITQLLEERENLSQSGNFEIDDSVKKLLQEIDLHEDVFCELILQNSKSTRTDSIPRADLAIMLVLLTEIEQGLEIPVALKEAKVLADDFGGTDASADFVHAIIANIQKTSS